VRRGDPLRIHPEAPALEVRLLEDGRYFVAFGAADEQARASGRPWATASWLFLVEPLSGGRSRFISRFRCACSKDLATRLLQGPYVGEAVGFVMDRQMLLGVKERAERHVPELGAVPT
jgi:hypothetical protein